MGSKGEKNSFGVLLMYTYEEKSLFAKYVRQCCSEIQKILVVHPMFVLTTKAASLQDKFTTREVIRSTGQLSVESTLDSRTIRSSTNAQLYLEYMPPVWQPLTRILVLCTRAIENIIGSTR